MQPGNVRGIGEKEEELDKTVNESNIKISVITENKRKLKGSPKETENYVVICSRVTRIHYRPVGSDNMNA
jgi:hypothetical protein